MEKDMQTAAAHELLCRLAAATVCCPRHWCRLRRCRRDGVCRGPLRPIDAQSPSLRLPPCIGDADAPPMASFRAAFGIWAKTLAWQDAMPVDSAPERGGGGAGAVAAGRRHAAAPARFDGPNGSKP